MSTISQRPDYRSNEVSMDSMADPRTAAFCSPDQQEVFHAVANHSDVWKPDPFDVETIHTEARIAFERLVNRASNRDGSSSGRILLLQGQAGSGKTHLMRAFRNWTHARGRGYYGYMQMTSATNHYGRYVLNNLIDSLDHPYYEPDGEISGLSRLSTAIAESARGVSIDRLDQIRSGELDHECLARVIDALADQIIMDERFNNVDTDLVRALLYLQANDPRIKSRVLKYLHCEDLSDHDSRLLGGTKPRIYDDAPQRLIARFGELMMALEGAPLILCVDQLEDIYDQDDAEVRFRRAMAMLCGLVSAIPSAVVVISCLEDFYKKLRTGLARPILDRIEKDPPPIVLKGLHDDLEVAQILTQRLKYLYDIHDAPFREDEPTFPFPSDFLRRRVGMRTREILEECQVYRERCVAAKKLVDLGSRGTPPPPPTPPNPFPQMWNDFRTSFSGEVPADDKELAALLAGAIRTCSEELESGHWFEADGGDWIFQVEDHAPDNTVGQLLIGVCNKSAKGGALGKQVQKVMDQAGDRPSSPITPVLVRSTEFPSNPTTAIAKQIGEFIIKGGRRAVVEDSDWRTMLALPRFREKYKDDPLFASWLKEDRPLGSLKSLRMILDLDNRKIRRFDAPEKSSQAANSEPTTEKQTTSPPPTPEPPTADPTGPIRVGLTDDRASRPLMIDPGDLTRHAAFLGGTGSGKTTLALNVVEQLLLQGIPTILVDRKGDLCGYALEETWTRPLSDPDLSARRERLRRQVEIAVYTPGNPTGRPLSIALAPPGLGRLGSFDRGQAAGFAASALAGMMNYGNKTSDTARQVILAKAVELLAQLSPDASVSLEAVIDYIDEADPGLVNAIGRLDTRQFEKLVQDLEILRLSKGEFLSSRGEPLEAESLLGLGRHAVPGKTRLSIISTRFLGDAQDAEFWVSQLLVELGRWTARAPSPRLQAVVMFDEADIYLPAQRKPSTKEPMEHLLKRARSAGLGVFLATQSPGDFDYKCRDNISAWFVGRVKEPTALAKMKPMLSECRVNVESKLATQEAGQFHLLRGGDATSLRADFAVLDPKQRPEDEILTLARRTLDAGPSAR